MRLTEEELRTRLAAGEGPLCEWKASARGEEIRAAVVAFANTVRGPSVGVLFLGISPDGAPSGNITDLDKTQRDVMRYLEPCYPPLQGIELCPLIVDSRGVIAVMVPESRNGPHFEGPAFVRVGSETRPASAAMFEELIAGRTEPARLLRPWVGKQIRAEREYEPIPGKHRWGPIAHYRLHSVDAVGLILDASTGVLIPAAWVQVTLQPMQPDLPPLVKIRM